MPNEPDIVSRARRRWIRVLPVAVLTVLLLGGVPSTRGATSPGALSPAVAASLADRTVSSLADSGPGSLRDAIAMASDGEVIDFAVRGTIALNSQLTLGKSLTLDGPGASELTLSGGGRTRLLDIEPGAEVTVRGLRFADGIGGPGGAPLGTPSATASPTAASGTISATPTRSRTPTPTTTAHTATPTPTESPVTHTPPAMPLLEAHPLAERFTSARQSAELLLHAPAAGQPLPQQTTATATLPATLPPNVTSSPTAFPPDFTPSPTVTLTASASPFPTSPAPDEAPGGAIYNLGRLVLEDCVFEENQARGYRLGGGAIFSYEGTLRVVRSRFARNVAYDRGGAIYNWRTTTDIVDSSFEDNTGVYLAGAIASRAATLRISGSTFSGSRAFHWMDLGGTIFNEIDVTADNQPIAARLFLSNSTISGNSSGIYNNGWMALRHVTLVDNGGSGLRHFAGWAGNAVSLGNAIVANNGGGNCLVDEPGVGQGIVDAGGNLQYPGDGCGTGVLAADPLLGSLVDNGGLTRTRLPAAGSPAIDAANAAGCLELPVAGQDQRGRARPVDGDGNAVAACDSGAVEVGSLATPTPGFTPPTPPPSVTWSPTPTVSSTPTASPGPTADLTPRVTLTPSATPTPPGSSTPTRTPFIPLPPTPTGSPTLLNVSTRTPRPTADPAHSPQPGGRVQVYLPRVVKATVGPGSRFDLLATWRGIVDR